MLAGEGRKEKGKYVRKKLGNGGLRRLKCKVGNLRRREDVGELRGSRGQR